MVEPGDKVYISDFGIAKVIDAPSITTTGMAMGTPEYMAPEQCEGGLVDGQSDIYGLGIIIYEMVNGRPPFLADTPLAVAYKQVHETPPLLGKKVPDVPPRLELIVAKCLKKSKADRYLTADELLKDLDSAHLDVSPEMATGKNPAAFRSPHHRSARQGPPLYGRAHGHVPRLPMGHPRAVRHHPGRLGLPVVASRLRARRRPGLALPRRLRRASAATGPSRPSAWRNLFDGKRSTAWAAPMGTARDEAEIEFAFPGRSWSTASSSKRVSRTRTDPQRHSRIPGPDPGGRRPQTHPAQPGRIGRRAVPRLGRHADGEREAPLLPRRPAANASAPAKTHRRAGSPFPGPSV